MADNAKFCMNCGTKLTPDSGFCPNCGNKVADTVSSAPVQENLQDDFNEAKILENLEAPITVETQEDPFAQNVAEETVNETVSPNVSYAPVEPAVSAAFAPETMPEAPEKPKKNIKKPIIISAVLVVIIAILGVAGGIFAHYASTPVVKLGKSIQKVFKSGKTYTITAENNWSYDEDGKNVKNVDKYKADVKFDFENRYIAVGNVSNIWTYHGETEDYKYDGSGYIDCKNNEIGVYFCEDDREYYLFNGVETYVEDGETEHSLVLNDENMAKFYPIIGDLMAALAGEKVDENELISKYFELLEPVLETYGIDINEIPDIYDVVSEKTVKSIEKKLTKALTDEKWLKENLGYEKSKKDGETIYSFKINYKSVKAIADLLEDDVFDIVEDVLSYMQKDYPEYLEEMYAADFDIDVIKDDYKEALKETIDEMKSEKLSISFQFGVKKGALSSAQIKIDDEVYKLTIEETDDLSVKASDYNKYYDEGKEATKDDHDEIEGLKDMRCIRNMYNFAYAVEDCYDKTGKVPATEDDFKAYMYDETVPVCPWHNKAYKINIDENTGIVTVECTDPDCAMNNNPYESHYKYVYDYSDDYVDDDYYDDYDDYDYNW